MRSIIKNIIGVKFYEIIMYYFAIPFRIPNYRKYSLAIAGSSGLEVGGPSSIFRYFLPIYYAKDIKLDGVNFSLDNIWESGELSNRDLFKYLISKNPGKAWKSDATELDVFKKNSYDFILSCNNLEHIANPIKALLEWKRVLKSKGILILVLPKKEANFDWKRPVTSFDHLLSDYHANVSEEDDTHFNEILELHDLSRDDWVKDYETFSFRVKNNFTNRSIHHHVFDSELIKKILSYVGFDIMDLSNNKSDYFVLARLKN